MMNSHLSSNVNLANSNTSLLRFWFRWNPSFDITSSAFYSMEKNTMSARDSPMRREVTHDVNEGKKADPEKKLNRTDKSSGSGNGTATMLI